MKLQAVLQAALSDVAGQVDDYATRTVEEALTAPARAPAGRVSSDAPYPGLDCTAGPFSVPREPSTDGSHDQVGIVMAKSAEGDAVARFFGGRAEVIEQPSFWEIRAPHRLVIPYA